MDFYPRPPRGGRPQGWEHTDHRPSISIHALREEGDFLSTDRLVILIPISIHALREEGDRFDPSLAHGFPISIHALREEGDLISQYSFK